MWTTDAQGRLVYDSPEKLQYAAWKQALEELKAVESLITRELAEGRITGLQAHALYRALEEAIRRFKAKKPPFSRRRRDVKCWKPKEHAPGCDCAVRGRMLAGLVERHREGEDVEAILPRGVTIEQVRHLDLQRS